MGGWAAFLLFFLRANYAHIFALRTISAARGESAAAVGGALRFVHPFGGALAPLGSPPGRLALLNYSGAEFLPRLFFSNGRPQNRGAARGLLPPRKAILSFAHINL